MGQNLLYLTCCILEGFIAPQGHNSEEEHDQEGQPRWLTWGELLDQEDVFSALLDRILKCSSHSRNVNRTPAHAVDSVPITENDFLLWRVRCSISFRVIASSDYDTHEHAQVGVEEEAVFFLLQKAEPPHELRSAFTRGSVQGWVYLETSMKEHLVRLLMRTPGIIHTWQTGVVRQPIDFQDWTKMLMMQDGKLQPVIGQWVRVRKGTYKGDVGVVGGVENWSGVHLLLLPCQPPPHLNTSLKRKCSQSRPEAALFDPITTSQVYQIDPLKQDDDVYLFPRQHV